MFIYLGVTFYWLQMRLPWKLFILTRPCANRRESWHYVASQRHERRLRATGVYR